MTDKIIINEVDVSKCEYFQSTCRPDYSGGHLYKNICRNNGFYDCNGKPCAFKCKEYKKRLKRKEQECEELKEWQQANQPTRICETCTAKSVEDMYKYKQALDEIENKLDEFAYDNQENKYVTQDILNIINKAKEQ